MPLQNPKDNYNNPDRRQRESIGTSLLHQFINNNISLYKRELVALSLITIYIYVYTYIYIYIYIIYTYVYMNVYKISGVHRLFPSRGGGEIYCSEEF